MSELLENIIQNHGTNPLIFIFIWVISIPFYWYGWYMIGHAAFSERHRLSVDILSRNKDLISGIAVNRTAWISPYAYLIYSGKSLPLWFWLSLSIWLFAGLIIFFKRIKSDLSKTGFFWSAYSLVYDSLNHFIPYKRLMEQMLKYLDSNVSSVIADIGCGTGNIIKRIDNYSRIVAIDNNKEMLKRASSKVRDKRNIKFILSDINNSFPLENESIDSLVCSNVVYAVNNPSFLFSEFHRILKPGGKLVITNPISEGILPIIREHLVSSGIIDLIKSIILLPAFLFVIVFNLIINKKVSDGDIEFLSESELVEIIDKYFEVVDKSYVYGGENVVILARRR